MKGFHCLLPSRFALLIGSALVSTVWAGVAQAEAANCQADILSARQAGNVARVAEISQNCCDNRSDAYACNQLGFLIDLGSIKSQVSAASYFQKSCDLGYFGGCKNVASAAKDAGDLVKAKDYYDKACELKDGDSCAEAILLGR